MMHEPDRLAQNAGVRQKKVMKLLARLHAIDNFSPTPDQVNALPEKLRLHSPPRDRLRPAGLQVDLIRARENIEALLKVKAELEAELAEARKKVGPQY